MHAAVIQRSKSLEPAKRRMLTTNRRADKDPEVSPNSLPPHSSGLGRPKPISQSIAPWESPTSNPDFGSFRGPDSSGGRIPQINRQPPAAPSPGVPWSGGGNGNFMPSSVFGSFYDDSNEDFGQLSPGFRPSSGQEDSPGYMGDDRRPSIASATTVSSVGSKSSVGRNFHKKLQGFFGDDYPAEETPPRQGSIAAGSSFPPGVDVTPRSSRNRNNSVNTGSTMNERSRPVSPSSFSRPRSPSASEVTPWEFQDVSLSVLRRAIVLS